MLSRYGRMWQIQLKFIGLCTGRCYRLCKGHNLPLFLHLAIGSGLLGEVHLSGCEKLPLKSTHQVIIFGRFIEFEKSLWEFSFDRLIFQGGEILIDSRSFSYFHG